MREEKTIVGLDLISELLTMPERIREAQKENDRAQTYFRAELAEKSVKALGQPIFPGKKSDDPMRCAANDDERKLAIEFEATNDTGNLYRGWIATNEAARELIYLENRFEVLKLIAQIQLKGF